MPTGVNCCFGVCANDKRKGKDEVRFFPFPRPCMSFRTSGFSRFFEINPNVDRKTVQQFVKEHIRNCETCERCEKWVRLCKRKDGRFDSISDVRPKTCICSQHFPPGISRHDLVHYLPGEKKRKRASVFSRLASKIAAQTGTTDEDANDLSLGLPVNQTEPETANPVCSEQVPVTSVLQDDDVDDQQPDLCLDLPATPLDLAPAHLVDGEQPQLPATSEVHDFHGQQSNFSLDLPETPLDLAPAHLFDGEQPQLPATSEVHDFHGQQSNFSLDLPETPLDLPPANLVNGEQVQLPATSEVHDFHGQQPNSSLDLPGNHPPGPAKATLVSGEVVPTIEDTAEEAWLNQEITTCNWRNRETQTDHPFATNRSSQTTFTVFDVRNMQEELKQLKATFKEKITESEATISALENRLMKEPFESFEDLLKDNQEACDFYTGFQYNQLVGLFEFFMDGVQPSQINYWGGKKFSQIEKKILNPMQELILTLVRLRSGLLVDDIAYRFGVSEGIVSRTVTTWVLIMHQKFKSIEPSIFASREKVKETLPERFKKMRNIRIIIDGAEIFCQTPNDFSQQSNTYSQYKAHNTFKVLLGCTPTGAISFVSELYEGSISDRQLVINSGLIDLLEEGDLVLADRGFTVKDITDQKNIDLRIPAFMHGRDKLSPQEEMNSRAIAKCRIFVEHAVRRLKEFRIFQRTLPLNMRHIASQMVKVCAFLTNFQPAMEN